MAPQGPLPAAPHGAAPRVAKPPAPHAHAHAAAARAPDDPLAPGTLRVLVLSARGLQPVPPSQQLCYDLRCGAQRARSAPASQAAGSQSLVWNGLHTFDVSDEMDMSMVVRDGASGAEAARCVIDLAR
jgi:hypothetical protein